MKAEFVAYATQALQHVREDYKEFVKLSLVYLDDVDGGEMTFQRPGALHKARWMAKLLYSLKIALLEKDISELPPGTITTRQQVPNIRAFVTFVTHVYCIWWQTCKKTVDAPWHDLQLYKRLMQYKMIDKNIAQSATRDLNRHRWYLTAEMVPLALFSHNVPDRTQSTC